MALPLTSSSEAGERTGASLTALRTTQTQARYPGLLAGLLSQNVLASRCRAGSGLVTVAVEQGMLGEADLAALGTFRLHQFQLCHWYDFQRIEADRATSDPQLDHLPANTIHIFSGTAEGHLLAYACLQSANALTASEAALMDQQQTLLLTDTPRPLFASERELFGSACFASLPALRAIPLAGLGELNCFLRNQTLVSPLSTIAAIETLLLMTECILCPEAGLRAVLGASDPESRRLLAALGFPMLYAPHAPVVVPFLPYKHYWAVGEVGIAAQGKYWPFVVAVDDLRAEQPHFEQFDQILAGGLAEIRRAIVAWRRQQTPVAPTTFVPSAETNAAQMWYVPSTNTMQKEQRQNMLGKRSATPAQGGDILPSPSTAAEEPETNNSIAATKAPAVSLNPILAGGGPAVQRYKSLSFDLLQLTPGMQVLDVGCGEGTDLSALAERVGEEGLVVGVDHDPHILRIAEEAQRERGNVRVVLARAEHLPNTHRSFDAVRADRLLQSVPEPATVLNEIWRVLRPGGVLTLAEVDWQAVALYPASPAGGNEDHTLHLVLQHICVHPLIGRRLSSLLHHPGGKWEQIEARVETLLFTSWAEADALLLLSKAAQTLAEAEQKHAEHIQAWLRAIDVAAQQGDFIASMPLFIARARKTTSGG